jgi:hypothetical protein
MAGVVVVLEYLLCTLSDLWLLGACVGGVVVGLLSDVLLRSAVQTDCVGFAIKVAVGE